MAKEYDNDQQKFVTRASDERHTTAKHSQEEPEQTTDQEEELFFWSEPGVCG